MKIDIIGSVASGKTTLAAELSTKYKIPYYEKDNIVWERTENGDKKRTEEVRDKLFLEILSGENWIVEGSPRECLNESFEVCDYIILLDVNIMIRLYRVLHRWFKQRIGKERYNSKPTMSFLKWNIKWVFEFDKDKKKLLKKLQGYENLKVFKNSKEAMAFIDVMYDTEVEK